MEEAWISLGPTLSRSFISCNNMKAGSEGGKAPKCGYFESGQCKPIYIKHENVFSAEDKASNLCR